MDPAYVAKHPFSPLIHYTKRDVRYKKCPLTGKRAKSVKERPIKYASHRDACVLSYYAQKLNELLDNYYDSNSIGESIIAYRSLGYSNYDFAAEAMAFSQTNSPVKILAFDVTGFFDNLDHSLLKRRLKSLMGVRDLPTDWYKVFRAITLFHFVDIEDLKAHPEFGSRLKQRHLPRLASVDELKSEKVPFRPNPELAKGFRRGIPQGTPISAAASNLYMIEFDLAARIACDLVGAFYRRYSDDILIICKPDDAPALKAEIIRLITNEKLEIAAHKTEETIFDSSTLIPRTTKAAQYLGFTLDEGGAAIRESSISRQWRKLRRALRRARKSSLWRLTTGLSGKIHTKRLFRRFSYLKLQNGKEVRVLRNFSSYARRSAKAFGDNEKISKQIKRFERAAIREISRLK
ncbi:reverse transcriptase/maturase family protein [Xanthobacter oligotrophicus]|uniref:reverse transcriptase/maturase family protein n=1 Tax=Xanthobacter oligotrophicus TaxID=2607286 RepID=UPI001EE593FA|nr:reverse transcriptase/maturase family protein [Xanthobacter oligotrophicus]MCG5238125.1 reverse transcriptase/maturase family protein [Xanthobacter oligotrophicus]